MTDVHSVEQRSFNMSRIKHKDTKPEISLRSVLHKNGFRFRVNYNKLPGNPDIVCKKYNTCIFVHGCFWHRHSNCKYASNPSTNVDFWEAKFARTKERDVANKQRLIESNWNVLVVWECDIRASSEAVGRWVCMKLRGGELVGDVEFTSESVGAL